MTANALVAAPDAGRPSPWAGVWIVEDIELIAHGVRSGSWVDGTLGVVGAGLDGLAFISDPVGALLQYGIAWLIEHVKPLSEALDWLAGDPAAISAHAQTWRNVALSLTAEADGLTQAIRSDLAQWTGSAATAYRTWASRREQSLRALGKASDTLALMTEAAGALVSAVRLMVRDAVATVVSRLIVYAVELLATAGLAAPLVVEQVATLCAAWAAKIARWLKSLLASLRNLLTESSHLGRLIDMLSSQTRVAKGGGLTVPSGGPNPDAMPHGERTTAHPTRMLSRGLRRENDAADVLARHGFDVEQNPGINAKGKYPYYKVEGEFFDCYAPSSGSADQVRRGMKLKVVGEQADRLVLDLDDCPVPEEAIADLLRRRPIEGLKEVVVVKDGRVEPFFHLTQRWPGEPVLDVLR